MTTFNYATRPNPTPQLFSDEQWAQIQQLLDKLDHPQSLWLSGFLAARPAPAATLVSLPSSSAAKILIAFGSETGNSEALARKLGESLKDKSISYQLSSLADLKPRALTRVDYLLIICSTHGDGDPPEPAAPFYEALMAEHAPRLADLKFAVLALGDSSYEHFCTTGVRLDERLEQLGGRRMVGRQECDVDFEKPANDWMQQVLAALPAAADAAPAMLAASVATAPASIGPGYSKQNPLAVEVLENICLSNASRATPVHHLELLLDQPDFLLEPGDAVGVLPHNPPALVAAVLDATGLAGDQAVMVSNRAMPLVEALREHLDLTIPSQNFLTEWAQLSKNSALIQHAESDTKVRREFLRNTQIINLLTSYTANPEAQQLVDNLRPLQPRLYDIANYREPDSDELHLTLKRYRYTINQHTLDGIASDYLRQLQPGETVRIYPHHNKRFHLPEEKDVPLILIASSTGIAPFRAFVQQILQSERAHSCWLVFRERSFEDDFLYQVDWQQAAAKGVVSKLDTAFYQDHPERTLADPLVAQLDELSQWLERGAHVYLCGDKEPLAECEAQLQAQYDARQASPAWKQLAQAKRIHRNLY